MKSPVQMFVERFLSVQNHTHLQKRQCMLFDTLQVTHVHRREKLTLLRHDDASVHDVWIQILAMWNPPTFSLYFFRYHSWVFFKECVNYDFISLFSPVQLSVIYVANDLNLMISVVISICLAVQVMFSVHSSHIESR